MKELKTGQFFGQTSQTFVLDGVTLTDTVYTHPKVDWHYHENAYFTFILQGCVLEGNKKETYHCPAGSLLFHKWQEAHYNEKSNKFTRGFHIELEQRWFDSLNINLSAINGSIKIVDPGLKLLAHAIFKETKIGDESSHTAIDALLMETIGQMAVLHEASSRKRPAWVNLLRDTLNDGPAENWSLDALSKLLQIHPVHLSRDFRKYFHCSLGAYIRKIKIQRSLHLLMNSDLTLTDIAYLCGFSDQSHFTRCFKAVNNINPSRYRRLVLR